MLKLSIGVVMESKAQLVGIHERVRSDFEGKQPPIPAVTSTAQGGKRAPTATNPSAEDAAELLRYMLSVPSSILVFFFLFPFVLLILLVL